MDLKELVRVILLDVDRAETAELAAREQWRSDGFRLVKHDQIGRDLELRDAVTGEVLYLGAFNDGVNLMDDSKWADVDSINFATEDGLTLVEGVPEALQMSIREWVENHVLEARAFAED